MTSHILVKPVLNNINECHSYGRLPSGSCLHDRASSRSLAVEGSIVKIHSFLHVIKTGFCESCQDMARVKTTDIKPASALEEEHRGTWACTVGGVWPQVSPHAHLLRWDGPGQVVGQARQHLVRELRKINVVLGQDTLRLWLDFSSLTQSLGEKTGGKREAGP